MKASKWGVLAIFLSLFWLSSACQRQEEVATAPPAERPTAAQEQPPTVTQEQPPTAAQEQPPTVAEEPARPADEFMGQAPAHGPETIVFTAKNGDVTFQHLQHAAIAECSECHGPGAPAAIVLDRESAHDLCIGCHKEQEAGPVKCAECHVR
jgi:predicted CXXCH cytochrome family protein